MKKILLLIYIFSSLSLFPNDAPFFLSGGNLYPIEDDTFQIELQSEVIHFQLYQDHYDVTVSFQFYNNGMSRDVIVGFPYYISGMGEARIYDFISYTNGHEVVTEDISISAHGNNDNYRELKNAYTRTISFPQDQITETRVSYSSEYGRRRAVSYLFGTGTYWKDRIKAMDVRVTNNTDWWIYRISVAGRSTDTWKVDWEDDTFSFQIRNIEPNESDEIKFFLERDYMYRRIHILPMWYDLDEELLNVDYLRYLSPGQLRLFRNTIFAINGYSFKNPELNIYFSKTNWYSPDENFDESNLNEFEKCNINIIRLTEQKRKADMAE